MKNLIRSIAACITVSIVLSSCSQKLSLTKRHYRNGYHVSHTKKVNSVDQKASNRAIAKHSEVVSKEKISTPTQVVLPKTDLSTNNKQTENVIPPIVKTKNYVSSPVAKKSSTTSFASIAKAAMQPKKFLDNKLQFNKKNTVMMHDGDGDGHSLLWLLIVILLILWLLGFAGGYLFGGLIHLIIVVAVILFILWLLRII